MTSKNKKKRQLSRREKKLRQAEIQAEADASALVSREPPAPQPAMPLCNFAYPIKGLPDVKLDSVGFRGLGKLNGAHRTLWRMGMALLVDSWTQEFEEWDHECEENFPFPLFNSLVKQQRMRLVREVAVGLLCDATPLPTESVWHYAAYFAPFHFVLYRLLRAEINDEAQSDDDSSTTSSSGDETSQKERYALRDAKDARSTLEVLAMREHVRQQCIAFQDKSKQELLDMIGEAPSSFQKQMAAWKISAKKRDMDRHAAGSAKDRFWRKSVLRFLSENVGQQLQGETIQLPNSSETKFSVWEACFGVIGFSSLPLDGQEKADVFMELIFGTPLKGGHPALGQLMDKFSKHSLNRFAQNWSVGSTAFDLRCLLLLMEINDESAQFGYDPYGGRYDPEGGLLHGLVLLQNTDAERRLCCKIYAQWGSLPDSVESFLLDKKERRGEKFSAWTWAHLWHAEMKCFSSNDYDSPDARVHALESVTAKIRAFGDSIGCTTIAWERSLCSDLNENLTNTTFSPEFLEQNRQARYHFCQKCGMDEMSATELQLCARCNVVAYCSENCQLQDRENHKKICKKLERIVRKGTAAKPLPVELFLESTE